MKNHRSRTVIQLHRDRGKIGVAVKPEGTEIIKSKTGKLRVIESDLEKPKKKRKRIQRKTRIRRSNRKLGSTKRNLILTMNLTRNFPKISTMILTTIS